uniref:Uncharacterized protein n=1 Tax=Labrus bergylta TaxID=56723 RepID=A0A3Q3FHG5_9LABR
RALWRGVLCGVLCVSGGVCSFCDIVVLFVCFLQLYQCMSDLECREGSYCHAPTKGPAHSRCQNCRRRKRRCDRDGMCCPGNHCSNNICVPDVESFVSQRIPDSDGGIGSLSKKKGFRKRGRMDVKGTSSRGQVGDPCLRTSDCSDGLCCARHFWTRICKPVLREGQVCTRHRRKGNHGLELFQRCSCGDGLSCRTLCLFKSKLHGCSSVLQPNKRERGKAGQLDWLLINTHTHTQNIHY